MLVRAVLNTRTSHIHLLHCNRACTLVARPTRRRWTPSHVSVASLTLVVGPSSFSATQLCRLNARSLQFTRTRLPNFSSNCFTSGSIPEKSSLWGEHNGRNRMRKCLRALETKELNYVLQSSPACQGPGWTASAGSHSSSWTQYLWSSDEVKVICWVMWTT